MYNCIISNWSYPFSMYAKFSEKLIFLTPDTPTYVHVSGVKNFSFSENFANVLNGGPHYTCWYISFMILLSKIMII